eukprot:946240-Heterocapsa_arctica.AAC.1
MVAASVFSFTCGSIGGASVRSAWPVPAVGLGRPAAAPPAVAGLPKLLGVPAGSRAAVSRAACAFAVGG